MKWIWASSIGGQLLGGLGSPQFVLKIYRPIKDFLENTNENIKVGDYIITVQSEYHYQYIRVL